jgi:hypothetical protein
MHVHMLKYLLCMVCYHNSTHANLGKFIQSVTVWIALLHENMNFYSIYVSVWPTMHGYPVNVLLDVKKALMVKHRLGLELGLLGTNAANSRIDSLLRSLPRLYNQC